MQVKKLLSPIVWHLGLVKLEKIDPLQTDQLFFFAAVPIRLLCAIPGSRRLRMSPSWLGAGHLLELGGQLRQEDSPQKILQEARRPSPPIQVLVISSLKYNSCIFENNYGVAATDEGRTKVFKKDFVAWVRAEDGDESNRSRRCPGEHVTSGSFVGSRGGELQESMGDQASARWQPIGSAQICT